MGLFAVRGDNIVLLGDVDDSQESVLEKISPENLSNLLSIEEKTKTNWDFE